MGTKLPLVLLFRWFIEFRINQNSLLNKENRAKLLSKVVQECATHIRKNINQ